MDTLLALSVELLEVGGLVLIADLVLVSSDSSLLGLLIFGKECHLLNTLLFVRMLFFHTSDAVLVFGSDGIVVLHFLNF